jgi:hypothetical protein
LWQFSALPIRKNSRVSRNSRSLQRLCHVHIHSVKEKLISKVGESLGADRRKTEVMLVPH